MSSSRWSIVVVVAALMPWALAAQAPAEVEAGHVAAILGALRAERAQGALELRVGERLLVGDRLRTGSGDRAKIVLADDAVIDIGSNTEVVIATRRGRAGTAEAESVLVLTDGRVRAVAPPPRGAAGRFEVETPAAVAFRGGKFLVIHDVEAEVSKVVALESPAGVAGRMGMVGGVVEVEPGFATEVRQGRQPRMPQEADAADVDRLVQATTIVGTGRKDGLDVLHAATSAKLLSSDDLPGGRGSRLAQGLQIGTPDESLAERLSADVRVNDQPLLEYRRRDPGVPGATGVEVDF
jgi:hypothetical protein